MANPYTKPTISGYNASPPADDGSAVSSNEITWAKHKTKLADPIKTLVDSINNNVETAFGKIAFNAVLAKSSDYTVAAGDRGKLISVTNTTTITLLAAATAADGFFIGIRNAGTDTVTVDGNASETINGLTSVTLTPGATLLIVSNGTSWEGAGPPTITNATTTSVSGTAVDFTGLPTTVQTIRVAISGISTSGTDSILLQIGDTDGIETTGYAGAQASFTASSQNATSSTAGFIVSEVDTAADVLHGILTLVHMGANLWVASGSFTDTDNPSGKVTAGSKTLTATLDRLRLTTAAGSDTFDAGSINIQYE